MKVIAACLLAVLGGKNSPTAEDIKGILASVGADADDVKIDLLISQIKGKDITELIATGIEMLGSVPSGGGVAAAAPSGGAAPAAADAAVSDQKKEEKVAVKEESDDEDDFTMNLFD